MSPPQSDKDRGYAWVILAAGFLLSVIRSANAMVGVMLVEMMHHFDVPMVKITLIGALQNGVGQTCGILIGPVLKRVGVRPVVIGCGLFTTAMYLISAFWPHLPVVYICFGVLASLGYHAFHMGGMVAIQHYFDKRRAQANGIFMTGLSVGQFLIPGLMRVSIDAYAWQGALIIVAGVILQCVVLGALVRPANGNAQRLKKGGNLPHKEQSLQARASWVPIVMFLIGDAATQIGQRLVLFFTPVRCDMIGRPKAEAVWLLGTMGVLGCIIRPVTGWIADRPRVNKTGLYGVSSAIIGAVSVITTQLYDFPYLMAAVVAFGVINTGYIVTDSPVMRELGGLHRLEMLIGIRSTCVGVSIIILNLSSGYLLDVTGDPNAPYYVYGTVQIVGGIVVAMIPAVKQWIVKHQAVNTEAAMHVNDERSKPTAENKLTASVETEKISNVS